MSLVSLRRLSYSIGPREIIRQITWQLNRGERIALVGGNGAGKTTLLRIIFGEIKPESGEIFISARVRLGYLPQEEVVDSDAELLTYVRMGREEVIKLEQQLEDLRAGLEAVACEQDRNVTLLGELEERYRMMGGYELDAEASAILNGLGFRQNDLRRPVDQFSGGWRMRAKLARLLVGRPDALLLDEPTNHLDLPAVEWLEQYLEKFRGAVIIVSHDRYLINRLAQTVLELDRGSITFYQGDYDTYLSKKIKDIADLRRKAAEQEAEIERIGRWIERFRYKATKAAQVQSKIKELEKIERIDVPPDPASFDFTLETGHPGNKEVVSFNNVTFSYGSNLVFKDIDLHLFRGDRVALVGRNGAGKTTLTRLITGALAPNNGTIRVGDLITIGYYAQHLSEQLNPQCTVLEQVQTASGRPEKEVRNLLAIFNFRGDDVEKRIAVLSGGEKARVMLTAILARPANFIIMDEPTNHLDVTSREALEQALSGYQGTLLLISHDRSFLDKLVRRIIAVEDGGLRIFEGNYTEYHERISIDEAAQADPYGEKTAGGSRDRERKRWEAQIRQEVSGKRRNLQKTIENIENKIAIAEARKEELMSIMAQPDTYGNSSYAADLNREYRNLETDLQQLYKNWEQKSAALDALINDMEKRISQFDSQ